MLAALPQGVKLVIEPDIQPAEFQRFGHARLGHLGDGQRDIGVPLPPARQQADQWLTDGWQPHAEPDRADMS